MLWRRTPVGVYYGEGLQSVLVNGLKFVGDGTPVIFAKTDRMGISSTSDYGFEDTVLIKRKQMDL